MRKPKAKRPAAPDPAQDEPCDVCGSVALSTRPICGGCRVTAAESDEIAQAYGIKPDPARALEEAADAVKARYSAPGWMNIYGELLLVERDLRARAKALRGER
jgi:hypothetical protein